jgi:asparagine synthase (glutamine-hydrolysing)
MGGSMCGIAGIVNGNVEQLQKMLGVMQSRGPDYNGVEQLGNVIFGHNRLAIVDKSERSNQPLSDNNGRMFTYNGEVYGGINHPSDTIAIWSLLCDSKLPLPLDALNGMFAFGYFDGEIVYLVRDRFGIKPLYYYHEKDLFAFASTPASIATVKTNWNISQKGLQEYLSLGATMLHSMFEGIVAVPPGHYLEFNVKTIKKKVTRWYYPKYVTNALKIIEAKVFEAVNRVKLTCDWPQCILLSGGIDSTLVASQYQSQTAIHLASPEVEYADFVAKKYGINLIHANPSASSIEEGLTDFITKSGEPTMAGFIPWITCREIAKHGFRVAITANGADELFFGYDRMRDPNEQMKAIQRFFSWGYQWFDGMKLTERHHKETHAAYQNNEISTYLMFDLNKTLDYASMCHSVEVRVPYLDHELVEAALSITMEHHTHPLGNKSILKEILIDMGFAYDFVQRPKVGFSLHESPEDEALLISKAVNWYQKSGYEQLPDSATGRQQNYHQRTLIGLYLWHKIYGKL